MGWTLDVLICTLCHYCFTALIPMITIQDILMKLDLSLPYLSMRSFDNQEKAAADDITTALVALNSINVICECLF